jgi:hypothetical protein
MPITRCLLAAIAALTLPISAAAADIVFPDELTGVWSSDAMEPFSPPTKRLACIYEPRVLFRDGLIVSYAFGMPENRELPRQDVYLRCTARHDCQAEPSKFYKDQGVTEVSPGHLRLAFVGGGRDRATLCDDDGNCRVMARCGPIDWTPEEKAAGLPEAWDRLMKTRDE